MLQWSFSGMMNMAQYLLKALAVSILQPKNLFIPLLLYLLSNKVFRDVMHSHVLAHSYMPLCAELFCVCLQKEAQLDCLSWQDVEM